MDLTNVGQISAFIKPPAGWLIMAGQTYKQAQYPELAAIVPASWKYDDVFLLPDMISRTIIGSGELDDRSFGFGLTGGEHSHRLTVNEMPEHSHEFLFALPTYNVNPGSAQGLPSILTTSQYSTSITGGGEPHENMPPYLAVRWCIYAGR